MGKASYFDKLSTFLNDDLEADSYEGLAAELGASPGALRVAVHRMRRRDREDCVCKSRIFSFFSMNENDFIEFAYERLLADRE
jgi:hypothetical protein